MKQIAAKESRYYKTFGEFLTDIAKRYGSKTAVTSYHRGMERQDKSFEELKEDSFRFSKALLASGLEGNASKIRRGGDYLLSEPGRYLRRHKKEY